MTAGMHELSGCAIVETHCISGIEPQQITEAAEKMLEAQP